MKEKESIRDSFVKAAEKLFQKWGIRKTTLEDIAREAGKGKSSIYYYFRNKEAVLEAVAMAQADRITRVIREEVKKKETAREKLLAYVYTSFYETRRALTLYEIARGEIRATQRVLRKVMYKYYDLEEEIVAGILRFGSESKEFRSIGSHDIHDTVRAIMTIMRSLTISLFIENKDKKLIDSIIKLLSEGL